MTREAHFWQIDRLPKTPPFFIMARDIITLECTEAKAEGKPVSRYFSTKNKKLGQERLEVKKYNKFLRRHTVHRERK